MPYVEDLGNGSVRVVGDPRLVNDDNPDDDNDHTFRSWEAYYRTLRHPQHRKRVTGKTVEELLAGPALVFMGSAPEGEPLT